MPDTWSTEISCVDNGTGMTYAEVTERLGRLGRPTNDVRQRSFFGRGIRDVWLAAGAGYLLTISDGVVTEAIFYRSTASPFAFTVLRSGRATAHDRTSLGFPEGTKVAVPFRRPIRRDAGYVVRNLAQLRPVFEDGNCRVLLKIPGTKWRKISFEPLTEDLERSPLAEEEVQLDVSRTAHIVVRRAVEPVGRWTPLYGRGALLVRSRWAAHELTLGSKPVGEGGAHLYGEVRCDALDEIQHESRLAGRPELVVRVDRRGLNRDHWLVARLYEAIDRIVGEVVLAEEARSRRRIAAVATDIAQLDRVGLAHLNEAIARVFRVGRGVGPSARPGGSSVRPGPGQLDLNAHRGPDDPPDIVVPAPQRTSPPDTPIYFSQRFMRLPPARRREIQLHTLPDRIPPGSVVELTVDGPGAEYVRAVVGTEGAQVREPGKGGVSSTPVRVNVYASGKVGAEALVTARVAGFESQSRLLIAGAGSDSFFSELLRIEEDNSARASVEETTGVVSVFVGRPEFKELEAEAHRRGFAESVSRYAPYRFEEVAAALDACWWWAAEKLLEPEGEDISESAIRDEANSIRGRAHYAALRAFLGPEVMGGAAA